MHVAALTFTASSYILLQVVTSIPIYTMEVSGSSRKIDMFETSILNVEKKHIFVLLTFISKGLHTFQGPLGPKKTFFCEIFDSSTSFTRQKTVVFSDNKNYSITIIITCIYCTLGESMIK